MRVVMTDIYRIQTMNSVYEIKVIEHKGEIITTSKKMGAEGGVSPVKAKGVEYLEKLVIGASFDIPGVVLTSVVEDYEHFVISTEPKRHLPTIQGGFSALTEAIVAQVKDANRAVVIPGNDEEAYS